MSNCIEYILFVHGLFGNLVNWRSMIDERKFKNTHISDLMSNSSEYLFNFAQIFLQKNIEERYLRN